MSFKKISCSLALALTSFAPAAYANTPGYIGTIGLNSSGTGFFTHSGTRVNTPSCQSANFPDRWMVDTTTPAGQAEWATLLSAYLSHKRVVINGSGACTIWSDSETTLEVIAL